MKTRQEVEKLKRQWKADGCWDIWDTEGFEEYKDELKLFQKNYENDCKVKAYNKLYKFAESLAINRLGNPNDEPDLSLALYLERLEDRIRDLETKLDTHRHQCLDSTTQTSEPIYFRQL
jgi:hypothetical protein